MSDERLRELDRRWRASGAPEDEASYLKERIRVGAITRERVRAAAILQHQAAKLAIGDVPERWQDILEDHETAVRGVMALLDRLCNEHLNRDLLPGPISTMFLVVRSWLLDQTPQLVAHAEACVDACEAACLCPMPQAEELVLTLRLAGVLGRTVADHVSGVNDLLDTLALCTPLGDDFIVSVLRESLTPWLLGYETPIFDTEAGSS